MSETLLLQGNGTQLRGRKGRSPGTGGESALHVETSVQKCKWNDMTRLLLLLHKANGRRDERGRQRRGGWIVERQVEKYTTRRSPELVRGYRAHSGCFGWSKRPSVALLTVRCRDHVRHPSTDLQCPATLHTTLCWCQISSAITMMRACTFVM